MFLFLNEKYHLIYATLFPIIIHKLAKLHVAEFGYAQQTIKQQTTRLSKPYGWAEFTRFTDI